MAEPRRWFDGSQPQPLQGAVMLSYLTAAFGVLALLQGSYVEFEVVPLGLGVAAWGVANEKRWGYWLGVVLALVLVLQDLGFAFVVLRITSVSLALLFALVQLFFGVVVAVLYLHPQSRQYQHIWFK